MSTSIPSKVGMSVFRTVQCNPDGFTDTVPVSGVEWTFSEIELSWSLFQKLRSSGGDTAFRVVRDEGDNKVWETTANLEECIRGEHGDVLLESV